MYCILAVAYPEEVGDADRNLPPWQSIHHTHEKGGVMEEEGWGVRVLRNELDVEATKGRVTLCLPMWVSDPFCLRNP